MASIITKTNKAGEVVGYKIMVCVGRDEQYKQIWRTCTIKRPEGLTPAKERKEIERQADAWAEEQKAEFERTRLTVDKNKITFADFVENHWWTDHVEDGEHTPSTIAFFKYMSGDILDYFGRKKRLIQIDVETVKRYIKYLRTEAQTKSGAPYSQSTIQHHYKTLVNILDYAKRMHYIQNNPCNDLSAKEKPRREKGKSIDFLDPEQARRFIACLKDEPLFWRTYMNVLLTCGLRRGECTGLQWRDIDPDKLTLTICRSVTIDRGSLEKYRIGDTKTKESRTVPLSPRVYGLLMSLKREHEERFQMKMHPSAFIFCRTTDPRKPIYPTEPTRWQRKFVERYNLPDVSPHDLRHSAASLALESGADLKQVQQLLGHADPSTTMAFYVGLTEEAERRTVTGIEKLLEG